MKIALLILLLTLCFFSFAQDRDSIKFSILKKEVQWFIDTVKDIQLGESKRHVYTIRVYDTYPDKKSFCFIITYIVKYDEFIYSPYLLVLEDDFVLFDNSNSITRTWASKKYIVPMDSATTIRVKDKLLPRKILLNDYSGRDNERLLYWYDGHKIRQRFCEDESNGGARNIPSKCDCEKFADVKKLFSKKNREGKN